MPRRSPPIPPMLGRRGPVRQPKLALLIYCEGKNTEPSYLRAFARHHGNSLVHIEIIAPAGVPVTIVNKAKVALNKISKTKNSFEKFDQVWAIFDRDEHPQVEQALADAGSAGLHVGYSNPCFEVWLLLHHEEYDAPDHRHDVQRKYAALDRSYDPKGSKSANYALLIEGYAEARQRAVRMRARRLEEGRPFAEPYTDVDILTEIIIANGRKN